MEGRPPYKGRSLIHRKLPSKDRKPPSKKDGHPPTPRKGRPPQRRGTSPSIWGGGWLAWVSIVGGYPAVCIQEASGLRDGLEVSGVKFWVLDRDPQQISHFSCLGCAVWLLPNLWSVQFPVEALRGLLREVWAQIKSHPQEREKTHEIRNIILLHVING